MSTILDKKEITRLLKSKDNRELKLRVQLRWYFWNLKQYRNGGVICECDNIVPSGNICDVCGENPNPVKEIVSCKNCNKEFKTSHGKKFCSHKCNKEFYKRKSLNICSYCKHTFLRANSESRSINRFCNQKCYRKFRTSEDNIYKGYEVEPEAEPEFGENENYND